MLHFTRLRLSGFKSFVDPTELVIEPGLTGIVGPNGCGKSNLVEALRWVMGEASPRQMRGAGMDDVIFGGTASRPARNIAEVVIELDNAGRIAPPPFHAFDELQISRRIERDRGSNYRVNGREVRARDVQMLFADAGTGARSTALLSQGQIGALIAAKPRERRILLEEAAGITGLHSRRHEAELRLGGAATNLERVEDLLLALDAQLKALGKQARQAARYRNLSRLIRKEEAALYAIRWRAAGEAVARARGELDEAGGALAEASRISATAATRRAEAGAALPALRRAEAEVAGELQRLILAEQGLESEERRLAADQETWRMRLEQALADLGREQTLAADAEAAVARLASERDCSAEGQGGEVKAREAASKALAAVAAEVERLDGRLAAMTETVAAAEASRAALVRSRSELQARIERLGARVEDLARQRAELSEELHRAEASSADGSTLERATAARDAARAVAESAARSRAEAAESAASARAARQTAEAAHARLQVEVQAVTEMLHPPEPSPSPPVVNALSAEPGVENALAAVLGDDLLAPEDPAAPAWWRSLPPCGDAAPLPEGAQPLSRQVRGPHALARRLSQIGLVDSAADGERLQPALRPGQSLATRNGGVWRWDGYVASTATPAAAARLRQQNRLRELQPRLAEAAARLASAIERDEAARLAAEQALGAERHARAALDAAETAYAEARDGHGEACQRVAQIRARRSALDATATVEAELTESRRTLERIEAELTGLPDPVAARNALLRAREELARQRALQSKRQAMCDALDREAETRRRREHAIARDLASWSARRQDAERQIEVLTERRQTAEAELASLVNRPEEIRLRRQHVLTAIAALEQRRHQAADRLAQAEAELGEADGAWRIAEMNLAAARERRLRCEAALAQGQRARRDLAERITDRLEVDPDRLAEFAGLDPQAEPPAADTVERRLERLRREREGMGPVNLRAEQEAAELAEKMETLAGERDDLVAAIGKLKQGIAALNREGRQRLIASFDAVDRNFRQIFVRLFAGGRAHLALTEADDPLEAGLEIMASPPGKRLQALSLLSGGEQALAALALVFAVFVSNPAPICVLDEVDAPLDDANVDRFCTLLEEMAGLGGMRFLIITHHRMTMARMDRLFGVTMAERGVSQLVSVDLQRAEALRRTA